MTSIDFYTHVSDRLGVVGKLIAKALAQHGSVRVLTPDASTTVALDRLLWLQPATGFQVASVHSIADLSAIT